MHVWGLWGTLKGHQVGVPSKGQEDGVGEDHDGGDNLANIIGFAIIVEGKIPSDPLGNLSNGAPPPVPSTSPAIPGQQTAPSHFSQGLRPDLRSTLGLTTCHRLFGARHHLYPTPLIR